MVLFIVLLAGAATQPAKIERSLSQRDGLIYAQVFKDPNTLASRSAHDHVVRASVWQANIDYSPGSEKPCVISVTIEVKSLVADEPELRSRLGITGTISEKDRKSVQRSMLADNQLAVAKYPQVRFRSDICRERGAGELEITGSLEVRGVKTPVTVPVSFDASGETLKAKGSFVVKHTDFDFEPYSGFLGAVKNRDDIRIVFELGARS